MNRVIGYSLHSMERQTVSGKFCFYLCLSQILKEKDWLWFITVSRKMYKMLEYEKLDGLKKKKKNATSECRSEKWHRDRFNC